MNGYLTIKANMKEWKWTLSVFFFFLHPSTIKLSSDLMFIQNLFLVWLPNYRNYINGRLMVDAMNELEQ